MKFAKILRDTNATMRQVDAFADLFAQDNPNFDRSKFINAVYQ